MEISVFQFFLCTSTWPKSESERTTSGKSSILWPFVIKKTGLTLGILDSDFSILHVSSPYFISHFFKFFYKIMFGKSRNFSLNDRIVLKNCVQIVDRKAYRKYICVILPQARSDTFFNFTDFSSFSSRFLFFSHLRTPNIENRFLHNLFTRF